MKVGSILRVRIEKIVFGGNALARVDGQVVFIPDAIPGEAVEIAITHVKHDFARGKILQVLEPSPWRTTEPHCRYFGVCPGCAYGHLIYSGEVKVKNRQLREFLRSLPGVDPALVMKEPIAPVVDGCHYRNKIVMHLAKCGGDPRLGYIGSDNTSVTDIPQCALARPEINQKLTELRADTGFFHTMHDRMELTLRYTENDGVVYWRNNPALSDPLLTENVPGGKFRVPRGSFFQVNPAGGAALWNLVGEYLKRSGATEVVDAYCGSGFFACAGLAAGVKRVSGVESDQRAVAVAQENITNFGGDPERIFAADAAEWLPENLGSLAEDAVVIVDPPRNGLAARARRALYENPVRRLIYISCNPSTLLRDLNDLLANGFQVREARMVDMFPRCGHFEVFTVLERE